MYNINTNIIIIEDNITITEENIIIIEDNITITEDNIIMDVFSVGGGAKSHKETT